MRLKAVLLTTALICCAFAAAMLFTSTAGAHWLVWSTEHATRPITMPGNRGAQAIVVLTGGDHQNREAARLQRLTGLPILASGGDGEAARIKRSIEGELQGRVRWTETISLNTEENARFSGEILANARVQRIILVTHALHMRRARLMFSDQGLDVTPAPTRFSELPRLQWKDFAPSAEGRRLNQSALHEIGGFVLYCFRRWFI